MKSQIALQKLNQLLPLGRRQAALAEPLADLHQTILRSFVENGQPLSRADIEQQWPNIDAARLLAHLDSNDLIVLNPDTQEIIGAYPLTMEKTPHRIRVNDYTLRAMCALDALAVSPLFGLSTEIESICRVTDTLIYLSQQGDTIVAATPSTEIQVGIHWQPPQSCAAHSLCREMVFLRDGAAAATWRNTAPGTRDCFNLAEAIELATAFFTPLLMMRPR